MLSCRDLSKSFEGHMVLDHVTFDIEDGGIRCLMGASGSGKTTLLRILLGLEQADSGRIDGLPADGFSAVFQENRLLEHLTPVDNLRVVSKGKFDREFAIGQLKMILPGDCLCQPVRELSGGMKRRVAIVRAMMAKSGAVVMDEPFTGLDEECRLQVIAYILRERRGRSLIVATHQEEDAGLLGAEILTI